MRPRRNVQGRRLGLQGQHVGSFRGTAGRPRLWVRLRPPGLSRLLRRLHRFPRSSALTLPGCRRRRSATADRNRYLKEPPPGNLRYAGSIWHMNDRCGGVPLTGSTAVSRGRACHARQTAGARGRVRCGRAGARPSGRCRSGWRTRPRAHRSRQGCGPTGSREDARRASVPPARRPACSGPCRKARGRRDP